MKRKAILINNPKYDKAISLTDVNLSPLPNSGLLQFILLTENIHYGKAFVKIINGNFDKEDSIKIDDYMSFDEYTITVDDISLNEYKNIFKPKEYCDCRLFGYAIELQESVILDAIVNNLKIEINEAINMVKDYRLLAQFNGSIFGFSDDSLISFILKEEELINLDFTNVIYEVQM